MNVKRLILAVVSGFVLIYATDFLIHTAGLMPDYNATKPLWRPESEMGVRFGRMLAGQFSAPQPSSLSGRWALRAAAALA